MEAMPANNKVALGRYAERIAEDFLLRKKYQVLARNWRIRGGELDLVARDQHHLVFVEVRYRASGSLVAAENSLHHRKLRFLIRSARIFLHRESRRFFIRSWADSIRFDLVIVRADRSVEHIPAAFNCTNVYG